MIGGLKKLSVLFTLVSSFAFAQEQKPLAAFAPADSLATLSWAQQSPVFDSFAEDVNALEWQKSKEAVLKLLDYVATMSSELGEGEAWIWESLRDLIAGEEMTGELPELLASCAAFEPLSSKKFLNGKEFLAAEALLTVSADAVNPMPAFTALLRPTDPELSAHFAELQSALITCAEESDNESLAVTTLEQDGTTLYVVGDGSDFPVIVGSINDVFFVSSNPEAARGIVRKVNGSSEDTLEDNKLFQTATAKLKPSETMVGLTLDFDAIATLLESSTTMMKGEDATLDYALTRGAAMLRSLGGYAGHLSVTPEGLVSESIFATNPEGGDAELLKLINCATCKVSSPFLAPDNANALSSAYIPVRELFAYADSWVRGFSQANGEPTTLRDLLAEEDIDIDTLLLDWIGSEAHTFVLEPYSTDAKTLLYGLPQVTVIPVSSPEAAQQGLDRIGQAFWEFYPTLLDSGFTATELAGFANVFGEFAVRPYDYNGTTIHRVQYGFNGDLAYAFIGNYLVLGTPSSALETLIDTYQGSRSIVNNKDYVAARSRAPQNLTTFGYSQDKPNYQGLADALQLLSQPLAYGVQTAITTMESVGSFAEEYTFEPYAVDLEDVTPNDSLSVTSETLALNLDSSLQDEDGYLRYYYELTDLTPGSTVSLSSSSDNGDFYPTTMVVNATDNLYIASSDYADPMTFTVEEGKTYWLELTGYTSSYASEYSAEVPEDATAQQLAVPASLEIELSSKMANTDGYITDYYELTGVKAGDTVEVVVSSEDYYPSLGLVDTETGNYVANGTYACETDDCVERYELSYTLEEGKTYWVEVYGSLYEGIATYDLEVNKINPAVATASSTDIPMTLTLETFPRDFDINGLEAEKISASEPSLALTLPALTPDEEGIIKYYYELTDVTPSARMTVSVSDYAFYPELALIDTTENKLLLQSAYATDLTFTPEEGKTYWLEVSGYAPEIAEPSEAYIDENSTAEVLPLGRSEFTADTQMADSDDYVLLYYELTELAAGDTFKVTMTGSDGFDPAFYLLDKETNQYVAWSDYDDDGTYNLTYTAEEGHTYWLEVSGYLYEENDQSYSIEVTTGVEVAEPGTQTITLNISSETEANTEPVVLPTFTELLDATEILPDFVRVITEHADTTESHSTIEGNIIYSRSLTRFRW
ncbi:MAG: DUF3352 domain-containing protein [Trueperaceae bacterium]